MVNTIFKGFHFSFPPLFWMYFGRKEFIWKVKFNSSAIYDVGSDQDDINKLFGIRFNLFDNHKNSARYGWRWNKENEQLQLMPYCYDNGVRLNTMSGEIVVASIPIQKVVSEKEYSCGLKIYPKSYVFTVYDENLKSVGTATVAKTYVGKIGFRSGLYFGGNKTAPHKIKIKIH